MGRGGVGVTFCQVLCLCKTEAKVSSVEPYRLWPSPSSLDLNPPVATGGLSSCAAAISKAATHREAGAGRGAMARLRLAICQAIYSYCRSRGNRCGLCQLQFFLLVQCCVVLITHSLCLIDCVIYLRFTYAH